MGKKLNLVARVLMGAGLALSPLLLKAETLNLKLNASFVGSSYTTDSFNARVDGNNPNISDGIDANDVIHLPNLTDLNFIQSYTLDPNTQTPLKEDYRVFEPNETYWDIRLIAEDYSLFQGFTGTARIAVDDPTVITDFNDIYDVILYRYDMNSTPPTLVQEYDLRDPNNYTIDWAVTKALGNYSTVELMIRLQTNPWDLNDDGYVNFIDYSMFANEWQTTYDMNDLADFCSNWLWVRGGGGALE